MIHAPLSTEASSRLRLLPSEVQAALWALGQRFRARGLRVFLFGSVARTWPRAAATADLDLGYEWTPTSNPEEDLVRELEQQVANLPTIRPVDLVNFSTVSRAFREGSQHDHIELCDGPFSPTTH